ncbi:hypothetical protein ACFSUS_12705 [Spirosoma soli]|uniref:PH domain-containing protein n=1 Tax=Spirosoma soli TaxID=1770529 RepID=A0ABW5M4R0_9BACT
MKNSSVVYREIQAFRQPWLWVLLLFSLGTTLYRWQPLGIGIMVGMLALFWFLRLEVIINEEGIGFRWLPFQRRYQFISWPQIEKISLRPYAAIGEFGGWGFRLSWRGTAQTVAGNYGMEIKQKGKKRFLLLGTQQPDAIRQVVKQIHSIAI